MITARINKGFWIWLNFSKKDESYLNKLQKESQLLLKSPKFKIHLTLFGPYESLSDELVLFVKNISSREKVFNLETNNYGMKKEFFESFFIRIKESEKLNTIRKEFSKFQKKENKISYHPHISLSYGFFEQRIKNNLMLSLPKVKEKLEIANISIIKVDESKFLWEELISFPFCS